MAVPIRTCLGCRQRKSQSELVRLVLGSDGRLCQDARHRRAGRGAYICPDLRCLQQAARSKAFARSFRRAVDVGSVPALAAAVLAALRRNLALAERGGLGGERLARMVSAVEKMERSMAPLENSPGFFGPEA